MHVFVYFCRYLWISNTCSISMFSNFQQTDKPRKTTLDTQNGLKLSNDIWIRASKLSELLQYPFTIFIIKTNVVACYSFHANYV